MSSKARDRNEQFLARHADEIDELLREANAALAAPAPRVAPGTNPLAQQKGGDEGSSEEGKRSPKVRASVISYSSYDNVGSGVALNAAAPLLPPPHNHHHAPLRDSTPLQQQQQQARQQLAMVRLKPLDAAAAGAASSSAVAAAAAAGGIGAAQRDKRRTSSTSSRRGRSSSATRNAANADGKQQQQQRSDRRQILQAQKQERQWYKDHVLVPKQREEAARAEQEQREAMAALEAEHQQQQHQQQDEGHYIAPLDPARFTALRCVGGSIVPEARSGHAVVAFDDSLFLFGGFVQSSASASASASAAAGAPTIRPGDPSAAGAATMVGAVPSADLFVCSGLGTARGVQWGPCFYNGSARPAARAHHSMALLPQRAAGDAALLVFGGMAPIGNSAGTSGIDRDDVQESTTVFFDDAWMYLIGEQRWQRVAEERLNNSQPPTGRFGHSCVVALAAATSAGSSNPSAFVFGGRVARKSDPTESKVCADLFVLEGDSGYTRWTKMTATSGGASSSSSWPCARYHHAATSIVDGGDDDGACSSSKMMVHGGIDSKGNALCDLWELNARTRVWREVEGLTTIVAGSSGVPRCRHALVALPGRRRVMLVGGVSPSQAAAAAVAPPSSATAIASAACVVVVIGEEDATTQQVAGAATAAATARGDRGRRLALETLLEQSFVGFPQPHMSLSGFGGCAVSNGSAFVVAAAGASVATHRFALPVAAEDKMTTAAATAAPSSLFSLWSARRHNRTTTPVPHDIELNCSGALLTLLQQPPNNGAAAGAESSAAAAAAAAASDADFRTPARGARAAPAAASGAAFSAQQQQCSVFCHRSILEMRAPHLWAAISQSCPCVSRQLGAGAAAYWIARYDVVVAAPAAASSSLPSPSSTPNVASAAEHGRRQGGSSAACGLADAPARFFSGGGGGGIDGSAPHHLLAVVVFFLYRGVLPEAEACSVAGGNSALADLLLAFARAYKITSLVSAINLLTGGSPAHHTSKRAAAEQSGVVSAKDDTFAAMTGYTVPADVTLVLSDPTAASGTDAVHVHSAIVACASPVLRKLLQVQQSAAALPGTVSVEWSVAATKQVAPPTPSSSASGSTAAASSEQILQLATTGAAASTTAATAAASLRPGVRFDRKAIVRGLRLPLPSGTALRVVLDFMYSGDIAPGSITPVNALDVASAAAQLELPPLRAAAEQAVLRSLAPVMELSLRELCISLSLAARYECGTVVEALLASAAVRIAELDARTLEEELPLELRVDVLQLARAVYFFQATTTTASGSAASALTVTAEQKHVDALERALMAKHGPAVNELVRARANVTVSRAVESTSFRV